MVLFAAMEGIQEVGKWSKSRIPVFLRLSTHSGKEHGESLAESGTNVMIYGSLSWQVPLLMWGTMAGGRQIDTPWGESLGIGFI